MKKKQSFIKQYSGLFLLVLLTGISVLLSHFNLFAKIDYRFYDFMMGISKEIKTDQDIMFLDINDESLARIGTWPWTRDIIADCLIRMKELGTKQAVFDIEYLSPATAAVDEKLGDKINKNFTDGQAAIENSFMTYADKVQNGEINKSNAMEQAQAVAETANDVLYTMQRDITSDFNKDNDDYFGRAVQFFGNCSMTINMRDLQIDRTPEEIEYARSRFLFDNVIDNDGLIDKCNDFSTGEESGDARRGFVPALQKIIMRSNGAGFTNVVVDRDGIRRRVELLHYNDGKYVGQLTFAPMIRQLGVDSMERKKHSLVLHGIKLKGTDQKTDITIPLDKQGRMLINWLHGNFEESFRHVPAFVLKNLDLAEELIIEKVAAVMDTDFSDLSQEDQEYLENTGYFADEYKSIMKMKQKMLLKCRGFDINGNAIKGGLKDEDYEKYFGKRSEFFNDLNEFAKSFDTIAGAENHTSLKELAETVSLYLRDMEYLKKAFNGSFCLIGNTASSSTDLGVTPFVKRYANLGTHANVINTILMQDFVEEKSVLYGIAMGFVAACLVLALGRKMTPGKKNILGTIYVIIPTAAMFAYAVQFKIYIPVVLPVIYVFSIYIAEAVLNFRRISQEKKFLQTKMGAYVSPEVVKAMQKNPKLGELGAENRYMTALFSDVKTFSGFTETLNNKLGEEKGAVALQKILSDYLGFLTKAIQSQTGTVDKFVGDEIVSFFGAPLDDKEHAYHSCVAGIRMLQAEARYNEEHIEDLPINPRTNEPFLLHSRVGMNTGYMAVGNMGTEDKMNYTVMGNAVNLASRLEGTNKAYGSWIMCSDSTWKSIQEGEHAGELVARHFDCVRVINVKKPVPIHNILGLRNELPAPQIEASELFNEGMKWYMKGSETPELKKDMEDFKKALVYFMKAKQCYPQDESSDVFIQRCRDFISLGLKEPWDGVYTMETK